MNFGGRDRLEGYWDGRGLRRVIENLLNNALKYGCKRSPIALILKEQVGTVEISVLNQGNPISPADQQTLFRQFRRTSSAAESGQKDWGIGLTLVRGIAEAHGGQVKVTSSPEFGTRFSVYLPKDCRKRTN